MTRKRERAQRAKVNGADAAPPVPLEPPVRLEPVPRVEPLPRPAIAAPQGGDEEPALRDYVAAVVESRLLILGVVLGALVLAVGYLLLAAPTYRSSALLQVEDKTRGLAGLDDLQNVLTDKTPADTEIEIIRSWSLLGSVVDQLNLTVETRPRTFPVVGDALFRRFREAGLARPLLGMARFAWGGERLRVDELDVPTALLDEELRLVARGGTRFELRGPGGTVILEGEVGARAQAGEGDGRVAIVVSDLRAGPGAQFRLVKHWRDDVIGQLETDLQIGEKGKKTGIITVTLEGKDARAVAAIVDAVAHAYQRQNVQRRSEEAARTLEFIQEQLPDLKRNLDQAEQALNAYKLKKGRVAVSQETADMLERAAEVEKALTEIDLERAEVSKRFTMNHPSMVALKEKTDRLRAERSSIDGKLRTLPAQELDSARLERDVKVATELYFLLINKAQEMRVLKSGTIGNVRVLDGARGPHLPVAPRPVLVLALALLLGVGVGVGAALARRSLNQAIHEPDEIEAGAGLPVYASVPHSAREAELAERRLHGTPLHVLAAADPSDLAVESLRSLRTALQFALAEARNNVVTVLGSSPGAGKSFLSVNLAHVLASTGKRVLLVDGDLRRGHLHRFFGVERGPGLSEVITGQAPARGVVRNGRFDNLYFIATGKVPPNPAELVASARFRSFVEEVSGEYDLVLIDTPPILAVTDAAIVGRYAGVNLLVVRFGKHPVREIAHAVKGFLGAGVRVNGAVLNDVPTGRGRPGYAYHYDYRPDGAEA